MQKRDVNMENKENWFLWDDIAYSPALNMGIDEILLHEIEHIHTPIIRIYKWAQPSISIGLVQKYEAACKPGYTIVRRPTGGGIVFHDNDLTYTAVIPKTHTIHKLDRLESYHVFHRAVLHLLHKFGKVGTLANDKMGAVDRLTMQCFTTPTRYDVLADGEKFAGAAQRRTKHGILHQGSIDLKASDGNHEKLKTALIDSFEKTFNIHFVPFTPTTEFMKRATQLSKDKYETEQWNIKKKYTPNKKDI